MSHVTPETIPPRDQSDLDLALARIRSNPSTLAVLYVDQLARCSSLAAHLRVVERERDEWRAIAIARDAELAALHLLRRGN